MAFLEEREAGASGEVVPQTGRRPAGGARLLLGFCQTSLWPLCLPVSSLCPFLIPFRTLCTVFDVTEVIIWPQRVLYTLRSQDYYLKVSSLHVNKDSALFTVKIILLWNGSVCVPNGNRLGFSAISLKGHYGNLLR